MKNYIKLKDKIPFHYMYFYLDVYRDGQYIAAKIFDENKVKIKADKIYKNKDSNFIAHIVKINKKDEELFLQCLEKLYNTIILLGYKNYEDEYKKYF